MRLARSKDWKVIAREQEPKRYKKREEDPWPPRLH